MTTRKAKAEPEFICPLSGMLCVGVEHCAPAAYIAGDAANAPTTYVSAACPVVAVVSSLTMLSGVLCGAFSAAMQPPAPEVPKEEPNNVEHFPCGVRPDQS